MSRWFKVLFFLMVLFVVRMAIKLNVSDSDNQELQLDAREIYTEFKNDREAALDRLGGEKVTVNGTICDIVGGNQDFKLLIADDYGSSECLIECDLWKARRYTKSRFDIGMYAAVTGRVSKEQNSDRVQLLHCQVVTE